MSDSASRSGLVMELAEEFLDRYRKGERPPLKEYVDRHPDLAAEIKEVFPAMAWMEKIALADESLEAPADKRPADAQAILRQLGDYRIIREVGHGGMGVVYEAEQISLGRHVALKVLPHRALADAKQKRRFEREAKAAAKLHHTNIVPVFGVGEHDGLPYYAMQFIQGLGLDAVLDELKQLQPAGQVGRGPDPSLVNARRDRSAVQVAQSLMTGRLDVEKSEQRTCGDATTDDSPASPNGGSDSATSRLSSSSVVLPGESSTSSKTRRTTYWHSVAQIGIQVASALEYAHKQGIVHRDIKPSNLLLDLHGIVWVTDFGLAKTDDQQNLTNTGDILGTLRYMPPEALEGKSDGRSDIYSLGLTLYELLAFRPAYDERGRPKLIRQLTGEDPPRLDKLNHMLPRDLVTIIHKAIERDPAHRYKAPVELLADLQCFVDDVPIRARRASNFERLWRWRRRNPMVAGLAGFAFLLMTILAIGGVTMALRLDGALGKTENALKRVENAEREARLREADALVGKAHGIRYSRREGQRFAALAALKKAAAIGRELEQPNEWYDRLRNEAIAALALPDIHVTQQWQGFPEGSHHLAVSGDLSVYARSDKKGAVSVRRIKDDSEVCTIRNEDNTVHAFLSEDGQHLCCNHVDAKGQRLPSAVWHITKDGPIERCRVPNVHWMLFIDRPEGRWAVFMHMDGKLSVYDVATGKRLHLFAAAGIATTVVIKAHPHEPLVVLSSYLHRNIVVRDLRTGAVVAQETPPWPGGSSAAWHPSGRYLCVNNANNGVVRIYAFDSLCRLVYQRSFSSNHGDPQLTFNAAGDRVYATGWGGLVSMWDFNTGQKLFETKNSVKSPLALNSDKGALALASIPDKPMDVGVWSVADAREYRSIVRATDDRKPSGYNIVAIHPNGRIAAGGYSDGTCWFDLATGAELAFGLSPPHDHGTFMAFDHAGAFYTNSFAGAFRWPVHVDPRDAKRYVVGTAQKLPFHPGNRAIAASDDGRVVGQCMWLGYGMAQHAGGWILHPNDPKPYRVAAGQSQRFVSVSRDGRWVAFVGFDGGLRVFESASAKEVCNLPDATGTCRFSADGRRLLAGGSHSAVYATGTWEKLADLGAGSVEDCTSDGTLAVLILPGGIYRLVDPVSGREVARLEDPEAYTGNAQFTPDGTKLVIQAVDGMRVWDLRRIRQDLIKLGLDWDAPPYPRATEDPEPIQAAFVGEETPTPAPTAKTDGTLWPIATVLFSLRADPWAAEPRMQLGHDDFLKARYAEARAHYTLAFIGGSEPGYNFALRGHCSKRLGRWDDAIAEYDSALKFSPHFWGTRVDRAWVHQKLGQHAAAIDDLTIALNLAQARKDPWHWELRAASHAALGHAAEAEADRKSARDNLKPADAKDLDANARRLVQAPKGVRDPEHAESLARHATALSPHTATYWHTLSDAQFQRGKYQDAIMSLQQGLACDLAKDLNAKAWKLVTGPKASWDPVNAEIHGRRATALAPQIAIYWNTLGVAQYRLDRFPDAISSFHKSIELDRDDGEGFDLLFLSMCHAKQGNLGAAQACYAQARRWELRQKKLSAQWVIELAQFRTEADAVLQAAQAKAVK